MCDRCLEGLYLAGMECKLCPFGMGTCHLDTDALGADVAGFWVAKLAEVVTFLDNLGRDTS